MVACFDNFSPVEKWKTKTYYTWVQFQICLGTYSSKYDVTSHMFPYLYIEYLFLTILSSRITLSLKYTLIKVWMEQHIEQK